MSTHVRNIIYNLKAEKVFNLPDGNLKFYDDFIEVFNKKSYFKGGGAFWYDYRINYNGKLIELLEYNKRCISIDKFYEDSVIKKYLTKYGKKKFCLEK